MFLYETTFKDTLVKNTALIGAITLGVVSNVHASELGSEESIEDQWVVGFVTDRTLHATVNGQVTHGDSLHVRLVKENCDKGNLITFVYTYIDDPKVGEIKNKHVAANFMGNDAVVKILFTTPFLMGHRATIDIGWLGIKDLKDTLGSRNPITMKYMDTNQTKITDYFDILENSWSNDGVQGAIDRAVGICDKL